MSDVTVEGGLDEPEELEPEPGSLRLAAPGDTAGRPEWEAAAAAVLRKARRLGDDDPDDLVWSRLARHTLDGVEVTPLGTPEHVADLRTAGRPDRAGEWDVRSRVDADNAVVLAELEGGATSVWLRVDAATDLPAVLDGVLLDLAGIVLDAADPAAGADAARALLAHAGDRELHPSTNLGLAPDAADLPQLAEAAWQAGVRAVAADGTRAHDRGASDVQELAFALAEAARALRALAADGRRVERAARLVEVRLAATVEQFPTIAKLRAARRLWARMLELSGSEPVGLALHAVTSRPMLTRYDPWVNMLRGTVAGFAAGVGGADAVTVLPFDTALGRPDAFGRRIARNTSALLMAESHLARVSDPAGGAYAVERLTDDLAVAAWAELGRIEAEGLDAFWARVAETADRRRAAVADRSRPVTGVSEFPHLGETLPAREPGEPWDGEAWAAPFEALRDDPPAGRVFLATMGSVAAHTARAGFATNLLAAGGVGVDPAGATAGVDDVVAAYDGQPVVCLAGPDAAYEEWGGPLVTALREAGARHVVVAGRPREDCDDSCALGLDALAFLARTREELAR